MQPNTRYANDLVALHETAVFCHRVAAPLLERLQPNRESQNKITSVLAAAIATGNLNLSISKEFLVEEVKLRDKDLTDSWRASPEQVAWLMVHEGLSNYFVRYALQHWNPEVFVLHHVPKTAGTSVTMSVEKQGWFVGFPQTSFEHMCIANGLLGFAAQLCAFEGFYRRARIYVGGHYNLPDTVRALNLFGRCHGVTLCRPPIEIIGSAARFVWTKLEEGNESIASMYGLSPLDGSELRLLRQHVESTGHAEGRMTEVLVTIMDSPQFRSEYDEIFVKYFYNHEITTPDDICLYLKECDIFASVNPRLDGEKILEMLKIEGPLSYANSSVLSEEHFLAAMGGAQAFLSVSQHRTAESDRIYRAIVAMRAAS